MTPINPDETPAALVRLVEKAASVGWVVTATAADGPPPSIALRFASPVGTFRAYGLWHLGDGVKYRGGSARHVPPGAFPTLRSLKAYLGVS